MPFNKIKEHCATQCMADECFIQCRYCNEKVRRGLITKHLPDCKGKQVSKSGGNKHSGGAAKVAEQAADLVHQLNAAQDVVKETKVEVAELKADLLAPLNDLKRELDESRARQELESHKNMLETPITLPLGNPAQPRPRRYRHSDLADFVESPIKGVVTIGDLHLSERPNNLMATGIWARFAAYVMIALSLNAIVGFFFYYVKYGSPFYTLTFMEPSYYTPDKAFTGSSRLVAWLILFSVSVFMDMLFFGVSVLACLWQSPPIGMLKWICTMIYYYYTGDYWSIILKVLSTIIISPFVGYIAMTCAGAFFVGVYRASRAVAPFIFYVTQVKAFRDLANAPPSFTEWMKLPMEKIKHIRLVLVPRGVMGTSFDTLVSDHRPEMDRGERYSKNVFREYSVTVEVRTDLGYRYFKSWVRTLPSMWYKTHGRTLKRVTLNDGLMATALNRKTMLASRSHPEVAIDTMTRMISANPNYQEHYYRLYRDGQSVYRDMALVCGAIVSREVYFSNEHF